MLVLLLKDVNKIGKKDEVKNVSDGYANNFLFPKKLAKRATPEIVKKAEEQKVINDERKKLEKELLAKKAKEIEGKRFIIKAKAGEEGQLFEAISAKKIAEKVNQNGFEISEKQIIINEPIKKIGDFKVLVKLTADLESTIIVVIDKEDK
ncbi:MAG: 50S ribosomal protein L9 [Candidatus Pacebacteria bacterium]|nr:50S ribosomal protein L9 [Candidatus Paceibacterota bacterium]